jgi:hypothetical protein
MKNNKKHPLTFFREEGEKRKAMFQKGGYNIPKNELPKKFNGGPGSGMGRMAADDAAFDAMMNQPTSSPRTSPYPSPESARSKLAELAAQANTIAMQNSNSQNVNIANAALLDKINNEKPFIPKPSSVSQGSTREQMRRPEQMRGFNATPIKNKKGGSVGRKK